MLRACALGDLVLTGPLLACLADPFLVAHGEHVALARAAGWVAAGCDADLAGLYALHADPPVPARLAPALRTRLASGAPALILGRPGAARDALARGLTAAGARTVRAHDPLPPEGVHAADHLLAAAGPAASPALPRIALPAPLRAAGHERLRALGLDPARGAIALHPGAGSPAKRWSVAGWARVARGIEARGGLAIVCGPADVVPAEELAAALSAPLLRELAVPELAAALAACRALLGHDSGVAHLAAALGVATLALFGPSDPVRWAPRGDAAHWLRAPGGRLSELDPAAVIERVRGLY